MVLRLPVFDIYLLSRWKREFPRANNLDSKACRKLHDVLIVGVYARSFVRPSYRDDLAVEPELCPWTHRTASLASPLAIFHFDCRKFNSG